jgi:hypothetical protein
MGGYRLVRSERIRGKVRQTTQLNLGSQGGGAKVSVAK